MRTQLFDPVYSTTSIKTRKPIVALGGICLHAVDSRFRRGVVPAAATGFSFLIACLGIFSISALTATLRMKEMGIRKVVGASSITFFLLHTKSFLQFLLISIIVASPLIYYLSSGWLRNFAYHIDRELYHFLVPGALATIIVVGISGYHAARNTRVNPVDVLKCD